MNVVYSVGGRKYDFASRTHIMGVLNVTPDSFSDGGKYRDSSAAVERALQMVEEGADFIDVGGESTRPKSRAYGEGAEPVSVDEELRRVLPVIQELAQRTSVPISIDTYKSAVAERALDAGASIVNDISGFMFDPEIAAVAARRKATVVLMHTKGNPKTMQQHPEYMDLIGEICEYLMNAAQRARAAGVEQIILDPGIGFGKTLRHNLTILHHMHRFAALGYPVLIGASRKSFIGELLQLPVDERLEGSLAATVTASLRGAHILRVHDVRETKRAVIIADAIRAAHST